MEHDRVVELLEVFVGSADGPGLATEDLGNISTYINLLIRWNARINLTAIREPEEMVTRHFGESLFAARHLFPERTRRGQPPKRALSEVEGAVRPEHGAAPIHVIDVGSGAGFPGIPIKIWAPHISLTLIESNHKKATFLREVSRSLTLTNVNVFLGRAEDYHEAPADIVTLRAVERFETVLPIAARLVALGGRLALLVGEAQFAHLPALASGFRWSSPHRIPSSTSRILAIGQRLER